MENSYLFYEQTVFPITTILACHADFSSFTQSYLLFSKLIVYFPISTPLVLSFLGNDLPHPPPDSVLYFSSSNLNSSINVNLNSHVKCIFHFWGPQRFLHGDLLFNPWVSMWLSFLKKHRSCLFSKSFKLLED